MVKNVPLEEMTLRQLRKVAVNVQSRYSRMRKSQPVAIQQVQSKSFYYSISSVEAKEAVEAAKFELGQEDRIGGSFADVDEGLADLPSGYGAGLCLCPAIRNGHTLTMFQ